MIDWHSHILPALDDGSRNTQESLALIKALECQGINTIVATPHFYANDGTVSEFLEKRQASHEALKEKLDQNHPRVLLGAEVKYYPGISKMADLKALRIENSKLLLLEMPMLKWTEYTIKELSELGSFSGLTIVIAHTDRYFGFQSNAALERLYESGILMQVNASYFISPLTRKKAIKELMSGQIHFIGSDCHNMTSRAPQMDKAFEFICKKVGDDILMQLNEYGGSLLKKINI